MIYVVVTYINNDKVAGINKSKMLFTTKNIITFYQHRRLTRSYKNDPTVREQTQSCFVGLQIT